MATKRGPKAVSGRKMKRLKHINWVATIVAILVTVLSWGAWQILSKHTNQAHTIQILENKQVELQKKTIEIQHKDNSVKSIQQQLEELKKQKAEVEKQLQAKRDSATAYAATPEPVAHPPANCGTPKQCIYMKESGNNPAAVNSIGCRGIGQACPGTKLPCGADYACQDAYFTNYAETRYNGWANAWQFWQAHGWW